MTTALTSYRQHPQLQALFKGAESRHFNDEEMRVYLSVVPDEAARIEAAQEVKKVDGVVVGKKTIKGIYEIYPYEQKHALAMAKCVRDVRYVTAYATMAMLMNDPEWFRVQASHLDENHHPVLSLPRISPRAPPGDCTTIPKYSPISKRFQPHQRSIYETYLSVKREIMASVSETSAELMEPFLQLPIDILAHGLSKPRPHNRYFMNHCTRSFHRGHPLQAQNLE